MQWSILVFQWTVLVIYGLAHCKVYLSKFSCKIHPFSALMLCKKEEKLCASWVKTQKNIVVTINSQYTASKFFGVITSATSCLLTHKPRQKVIWLQWSSLVTSNSSYLTSGGLQGRQKCIIVVCASTGNYGLFWLLLKSLEHGGGFTRHLHHS